MKAPEQAPMTVEEIAKAKAALARLGKLHNPANPEPDAGDWRPVKSWVLYIPSGQSSTFARCQRDYSHKACQR